jgi:hypothetical protein
MIVLNRFPDDCVESIFRRFAPVSRDYPFSCFSVRQSSQGRRVGGDRILRTSDPQSRETIPLIVFQRPAEQLGAASGRRRNRTNVRSLISRDYPFNCVSASDRAAMGGEWAATGSAAFPNLLRLSLYLFQRPTEQPGEASGRRRVSCPIQEHQLGTQRSTPLIVFQRTTEQPGAASGRRRFSCSIQAHQLCTQRSTQTVSY